jgi:hypothetical protein
MSEMMNLSKTVNDTQSIHNLMYENKLNSRDTTKLDTIIDDFNKVHPDMKVNKPAGASLVNLTKPEQQELEQYLLQGYKIEST